MSNPPPSPSESPQFSGGSQANRRSFFSRRFSSSSSFSIATINTILPQYSAVDAIGLESPPLSDDLSRSHESGSTSRANPRSEPHNPSSTLGGVEVECFEYAFPIRPNNSWCTLRLYTENLLAKNPNVSHYKPKTPKFWGGQIISGLLELELDRAQTIQCISLTLRGKVVTGSLEGGSYNFLDHDIVLWDKSSGDPHALSRTSDVNVDMNQFDGKFIGEYKFPFSFPFPTHVDLANSSASSPPPSTSGFESPTTQPLPSPPPSPNISEVKAAKRHSRRWSDFVSRFNSTPEEPSNPPTPSSEKRKSRPKSFLSPQVLSSFAAASAPPGEHDAHLQSITHNRDDSTSANIYPMPQTFLESQVTVSVGYELGVHIVHGRFRPDSKIKTNISYVPSIHAKPYSPTDNRPHPNPNGDSTSWFTLPTVNLGAEVDRKEENVECTLQLAKPLSYTRGTSISCRLMLSSSSSEAIDIVSKTDVPRVRLRRHIRYFGPSDTHWGGTGKSGSASPLEEQNAMGMGLTSEPSGPFQGHLPNAAARSGKGRGDFATLDKEVGTCLWQAPESIQPRAWEVGDEKVNLSGRVYLEGKISLACDMQPSSACPIFCVEYFVELLPFQIAGHGLAMHSGNPLNQDQESNVRAGGVLMEQLIEVATLYHNDGEIM